MNQISDLKKENNILGGSLIILTILGVIVSYFAISFYIDRERGMILRNNPKETPQLDAWVEFVLKD